MGDAGGEVLWVPPLPCLAREEPLLLLPLLLLRRRAGPPLAALPLAALPQEPLPIISLSVANTRGPAPTGGLPAEKTH